MLCLSAALKFSLLGSKSLWLDEIHTYRFATLPASDFWEIVTHREANMVLYYLLLRMWILVRDTEFWIRSLSALMALAAVVAVYVLATRFFNRRAGLVAAFLLAINPMVLAYAQEARGYALFLLLAICSTALFVRALHRARPGDWVTYALIASLTAYSHLFGVLLLVSHGVALLFWRAELPWRYLLAAAAGIAVLVSPLALFVITSEGKLSWVSEPGLRNFVRVFASLAGGKWLLLPYTTLVLVALLAAVRERTAAPRRFWYGALLASWLVVPVVVAFVVSLVKPAFVTRFFITGIPPLVMLVACGLDRIRSNMIVGAVVVGLAGLTVPQLVSYYAAEKENWRGAIGHLTAHAGPDDVVVFYTPTGLHAFSYYGKQRGPGTPAPTVTAPPRAWREGESVESRRAFLEKLAREHQRVWLVLSHAHSGERRVISSAMQDTLADLYPSRDERHFKGVHVLVYHQGTPMP